MDNGLSTLYSNNETILGDTHSRFVMAMACGLSAHRLSFIEAIDLGLTIIILLKCLVFSHVEKSLFFNLTSGDFNKQNIKQAHT